MKKLTVILDLFGFIAFQFLAIYKGEKGNIGFAIGYAILSLSFIILLMTTMILEELRNNGNN